MGKRIRKLGINDPRSSNGKANFNASLPGRENIAAGSVHCHLPSKVLRHLAIEQQRPLSSKSRKVTAGIATGQNDEANSNDHFPPSREISTGATENASDTLSRAAATQWRIACGAEEPVS